MVTLTQAPVLILANVERVSTSQTVPSRASSALITMTDPGGQWPATIDNTRHIKVWGVQLNRGGAWVWWLFQGDPTASATPVNGGYDGPTGVAQYIAFGSRKRDGGMPDLLIRSGDLGEAAGFQVRLGILTDADVTLGATITVN